MPTFDFTAPDGKTYSVDGPDGATPAQAFSILQTHLGAPPAPEASASSPIGDFFKSIPRGMLSGFNTAASTLGQATQGEMGQDINVPSPDQATNIIEKQVTGPLHKPEGRAGKFGASVGEFVGNPASYIGPGSIPAKVGMAVAGGAGSEAGGQLAEGTPFEGPARIAGAVIGGLGAAKAFQPSAVEAAIGARPSAAAPSIEDLKGAYRSVRNNPEVANAPVPMPDIQNLAAGAENDLTKAGFRPTRNSAEDTFRELQNLTPKQPPALTPQQKLQAEMNWETPAAPPAPADATIDDVLAARRAFGQTAAQRQPFPATGPTPDAVASRQVMSGIDDLIEQHAPQMIGANQNYSAAKTAQAIDGRIQKAELSAQATNSGLNIGNKIRQQAVQVLTNPAARRGLKPEEISMLQSLVKGTAGRNTLRWFSNVLGGGGGLGAEVTGDIASRQLGPIGWLLSPIGKTLKHIENHLTVKAANDVSEAIRSRSPLGQAIQSSADKWDTARRAYLRAPPNSASFASLLMTSRNLSNTLAGAGVQINPMQLLRSVQGTSGASADDEQQ